MTERKLEAMPKAVSETLAKAGHKDAYAARLTYQRNDWLHGSRKPRRIRRARSGLRRWSPSSRQVTSTWVWHGVHPPVNEANLGTD